MWREGDPGEVGRRLKPASRRWYQGLPAVTGEIDCGGERHRITWRRGRLVLEDHDLLAERSLMALGAERPVCVEVLEAWREMRGKESLYELLLRDGTLSREELAARKASHKAAIEYAQRFTQGVTSAHHPAAAARLRHLERRSANVLERERQAWAMTLIEALPAALRKTLALSEIVHFERNWHGADSPRARGEEIESVFMAIPTHLFEWGARRWRRNLKPHAVFLVEAWLCAPGEEPTCAAWADSGRVYGALSVPLSWFTDVWMQGIALVDGCFVSRVTDRSVDGHSLRVLALRWARQEGGTSKSVEAPALVTRGRDGEWHLHWV
jgi:hypothetical protein